MSELVGDDVEILTERREETGRAVPAPVAVGHLSPEGGAERRRAILPAPEGVVVARAEVDGRAQEVARAVVRVASERVRVIVVDEARVVVRLLGNRIPERRIVLV